MAPVTLKQMAEVGDIDRFVIEDTADAIAAFHLNTAVSTVLPPDNIATDQKMALVFATRENAGCIRKCHGRLRLENIESDSEHQVHIKAPNDGMSDVCLDIVQDLSVLLCDLLAHGLKPQANILFNRYFDVTGHVAEDPATLTALKWYMDGATEDGLETPMMVAVGGLSGGGKSRMSRELAPLFPNDTGARVVRTDVVRKRMMGVGLSDRLGSEGYTKEMDRETYSRFYSELAAALKQGHSVIADAVFANQGQREKAEEVADELNVPFFGLWVDAPADVRARRVAKRKNNVSDVTEKVIRRQLEYDLGTIKWHRVDSSGPKATTIQAGRRYVGI